MTYQPLEIPDLPSHQKAFLLEDGSKAVVQIGTSPQGQNAWNATPDPHLAVQIQVWEINEDGSPKLVNGNKVGPPAKTHTVLTSALAEGRANLANVYHPGDMTESLLSYGILSPHIV